MSQDDLLITLQQSSQCACFNIRKAMRHLTQFYDSVFSPIGIRSTQFSLLAHIAATKDISISVLAEKMVMERTTLTRNLRPMEKAGYIKIMQGADKRTRTISLTDTGMEKLMEAVPYWLEAQGEFIKRFGKGRAKQMLSDMQDIERMTFDP